MLAKSGAEVAKPADKMPASVLQAASCVAAARGNLDLFSTITNALYTNDPRQRAHATAGWFPTKSSAAAASHLTQPVQSFKSACAATAARAASQQVQSVNALQQRA